MKRPPTRALEGRRALLGALAASAFVPARLASAAKPARKLGYLMGAEGGSADLVAKWLSPFGYAAGGNLRIETRIAPPPPASLAPIAAELVRSRPDVLLAWTRRRTRALMEATRSIPIVCAGVADPIGYGLARNLRRPGGNVTGLSYGKPELAGIWVALLRAVLPRARRILMLLPDDGSDPAVAERSLIESAAVAGIECEAVLVADVSRVEKAFATARDPAAEAVYVRLHDRDAPHTRAVELATRHRMVSFGAQDAEPVEAGMLMAYWMDFADYPGRIAALLGKVLDGADPAEIPFELPDRTHFVLNRRTAAAIGLRIPPEVMLRVTRVVD